MNIEPIITPIVIAYLIGSIPFGLLLTRMCGMDIRKVGSGNIGATNVMRSGKKGLAVATLLLDLLKGLVAVKYGATLGVEFAAGLFVVLGHIFPVWLKFKGGKGVATALGVFFALNWVLGLAVCGIWLVVFLLTRFSSLSAIVSIAFSPLIAYFMTGKASVLLCLLLALIIVYTHRQNIARLLNGTEMAFKKKQS